MSRFLLTLAAWMLPAVASAQLLTTNAGSGGFGGTTNGQILSVTIPSATFTSINDLYSAQTFMPFTADIKFKGLTPAGVISAYTPFATPGTWSTANLTFAATSPSHTVTTGGVSAATVNRTIVATQYLRQSCLGPTECVQTSGYSPTEATSGSDAVTAWTLSDYLFHDDTAGTITAAAGLYTGSAATSGITPVNNNTITPPVPICNWANPPGERIPNATFTVEVACYHAYAMNHSPVAGVQVDATDGTHTATKYVPYNAMANSQRFFSQSCTANNGSNVVTCPDISGFIVGQRLRVAGSGGNIPGQPILASKSYTSGFAGTLTFSVALTVTTSSAGFETITSALPSGQAYADGAFPGSATITDTLGLGGTFAVVAPSGTCTATCTSTSITLSAPSGGGQWAVGELLYTGIPGNATGHGPQGWRITALGTGTGGAGTYTVNTACSSCTTEAINAQPLSINVFTGATPTSVGISTAGTSCVTTCTAHSATINHNYVGGTGDTVTVTTGVMPVYPAVFSTTDLASLSDGPIWFRFHAYPWVDAASSGSTLDSLMGADGTGCDWFYIYSNSQVCNSSNAAWFGTNDIGHAEKVSINLHNLWAYKDYAGTFAPKYAWVSGTAGGSPAVQSTNADPGSTHYYATITAAVTALAAAYGTNANGGVVCLTAAGSPYTASYGGAITSKFSANLPPWTLTSALPTGTAGTGGPGGTCPSFAIGTYAQNSDTTVAMTGSTANTSPPGSITDNIKFNGTGKVFVGADPVMSTSTPVFPTYYSQWNGLIYIPGASAPLVAFNTGRWDVFNSYADESSFDGNLFSTFSGMSGGDALAMGNTMIGDVYGDVSPPGKFLPRFGFGNHVFNVSANNIASLSTTATVPQSTSAMYCFNYWMAETGSIPFDNVLNPFLNTATCNNVMEHTADSAGATTTITSGDTSEMNINNFLSARNIHVGARANLVFAESVPLAPASSSNTGGHLGNGTYSLQATYAKRGGGCPPTCTETSTNGVSTTTKTVSGGALTGSIVTNLPCDPDYVVYLYLTCTGTCNNGPGGTGPGPGTYHAQTSANTDASGEQLSACSIGNANIAGLGATTLQYLGGAATPLANGPSVPAKSKLTKFFFKKFNMDFFSAIITDNTAHGAGTTANGARVGNWDHMDQIGFLGNTWQGQTTVSSSYPDAPCQLCAYVAQGSSPGLSNYIVYKADRSVAEMNSSTVFWTGTNTGEGNYCPDTTNGPNVLINITDAQNDFPIDMIGRTRPNNDIPGAYAKGCD